MPKRRSTGSAKDAAPRSRKAGVAAENLKKLGEQKSGDRRRRRQHDADRPDRGGPQGRKDKDFQRKF
jgi:hypothetical protein